ncbi:Rieske (2Fe-2S) protein [Neomicrococcus aestuarii]|uniref:Rieske (2Fe-2S) protein n=1 Tax=Neomicrococcus aestuarii TaxID=556325 RepID=UPI000A02A690|nr:Rieske (2Fe-2S) protein [Neomicrococcus aestuarii]
MSEHHQGAGCQHCLSRRNVLSASALTGVATLGLAACSPVATPSASSAASSTASGSAAANATAASSSSASSAGEATVAMTTSELAVGAKGTAVLESDRSYLFYRDSETSVKAYRAVCTHAGCLVEVGTETDFACPCHGSSFDPATGEPTGGPANSALESFPAAIDGTNVVIYLDS